MNAAKTVMLLTLAAMPLFASAQTQTIWRCGADGRSYSATPCAEGRVLAPVQARPDADVQAAQQVALQDKRLADKLRQERLQRESSAVASGGAAGIRNAEPTVISVGAEWVPGRTRPLPKLAQPRSRSKHPEADGTFRAVAPATRRAKG